MKTSSNATANAALREQVFDLLNVSTIDGFQKINERQYGVLMTDINGNQRYVRVGAIVADIRDDMTAAELMQSEIDAYNRAVARKEHDKAERKAKAERDKAERAAKAVARKKEAIAAD